MQKRVQFARPLKRLASRAGASCCSRFGEPCCVKCDYIAWHVIYISGDCPRFTAASGQRTSK